MSGLRLQGKGLRMAEKLTLNGVREELAAEFLDCSVCVAAESWHHRGKYIPDSTKLQFSASLQDSDGVVVASVYNQTDLRGVVAQVREKMGRDCESVPADITT